MIHIFSSAETHYRKGGNSYTGMSLERDEVAKAIFIGYIADENHVYIMKNSITKAYGRVHNDDLPSPISDLMILRKLL